MTGLNNTLFFFTNDCSNIKITPNSIEHAYCAILNDDLESAYSVFKNLDSPRANWGVSLVSILKGYVEIYPTFFGIRNFLEIDLDFLLKNNKISYVEQVLGSLDFLVTINQEAYKFTARVMLENDLYSAGLKYMEKSKNVYYQDPELHFMFAKYYIKMQNFKEAEYYINECLKLLPDYYPAHILKEKIEQIQH